MASNNMEEDEQFNQAFGKHTGITEYCREEIKRIKNNDPDVDEIVIRSSDADDFTNLAWRLLGRYVANNTHLTKLVLEYCHLTDEKMALLFKELTGSRSLERLDLDSNTFGVEGVRCMIPCLQNSPNLSILYLGSNNNVNNECFEVLVSALNEKAVRELYFYGHSITDTSALDRYNLPNLESLSLTDSNTLGRSREGIISLSNQLQKGGSTLKVLDLDNTGIDDEGAEILAASLKHNTKLEALTLRGSNITEKGHRAFLCLLNDVSSIENTYKSNHTLAWCNLVNNPQIGVAGQIYSAIQMNKNNSTSRHAAGRAKVIKYQLNSQNRKEMCELQEIEYTPGSIFVDIEPKLLPSILAVIGEEHGQGELYTALVHTAPELLSYIDRKAMIKDTLAKIEVRCAALKDEYEKKIANLNNHKAELSSRLALIDSRDIKQSAAGEEGNGNKRVVGSSSKKRQRT